MPFSLLIIFGIPVIIKYSMFFHRFFISSITPNAKYANGTKKIDVLVKKTAAKLSMVNFMQFCFLLYLLKLTKLDKINVSTRFKNISFPCQILLSNIIPRNLTVNPLNKNTKLRSINAIFAFLFVVNFLSNT